MAKIVATSDWFRSNFSYGKLCLSCAVAGVIVAII